MASSGATANHIDFLFSEEFGYATPKLDIRAVILDEEEAILLVKEEGRWIVDIAWRLGRRGREFERVRGEGSQGGVRL